MRRVTKVVVMIGALSVLLMLYLLFIPPWWGKVGPLSVALHGYQTNEFGRTEALFAVTNTGRHSVQLSTGVEVGAENGWQDISGRTNHVSLTMDASPILMPGAGRIITIPVPLEPQPWRVFAQGHREYPASASGKLGFIADGYLLKRHVYQRFYSAELKP